MWPLKATEGRRLKSKGRPKSNGALSDVDDYGRRSCALLGLLALLWEASASFNNIQCRKVIRQIVRWEIFFREHNCLLNQKN